eukprot:CAMPEP_0114459436 /NCGR_PEP_ID=MMETSP0104-20121206/5207_1 /TAXON_ID=37642 ORGANISM="Paraphysomonas imperforata, Strain PA2" /NCGR_SAMPLE_ID=MMETSP0104 /ASSEMBLY_ACC=CAM_ASM_000202 /LENGTH=567 /DNA_ID=CAMNT_0001632073 /DNA_START=1 /DNA_END=1701 /DNA_ORIENTATION=+
METSDSVRQQVEEAEQRGLAFFNKLSKQNPDNTDTLGDDQLRMDVEDSPFCQSRSPPFSASRQKFHPRFSSPPSRDPSSAYRHMSSSRQARYTDMYSPGAGAGASGGQPLSEVTVSFSFFIPKIKIPALSLTLHPGLVVSQVKSMVVKKVYLSKELMPSDLDFILDGRHLRDGATLTSVPVFNGAHLKVYMRAEEENESKDDSFISQEHAHAHPSSTPYQTPQTKGMRGGLGKTPLSGVPSSIKPSPYSSASPHVPADMSGLSFRDTHAQMLSLHRPDRFEQDDDHDHHFLSSTRLTSAQKTTPGGAVISEEASFYEILENFMEERPHGASRRPRCGAVQLASVEEQSHMANEYAKEAAGRYEATLSQLSLHKEAHLHQQMLRDLEDLRAERDMWSLASSLLTQDLLKDVEDHRNEDNLKALMKELSPSVSLKEVISRSIEVDERMKKGRVLKDWVEQCSTDKVHEPHELEKGIFPWDQTLQRLKKQRVSRSKQPLASAAVRSIHPDAQIAANGSMVKLDGDDHTDQETLLKVVWQYIRCGKLVEAQEVANKHNVHWLTAALLGVGE